MLFVIVNEGQIPLLMKCPTFKLTTRIVCYFQLIGNTKSILRYVRKAIYTTIVVLIIIQLMVIPLVMEKIRETTIGKNRSKTGYIYPLLRFPKEYADIVGKKVMIFIVDEDGERAFWIKSADNSPLLSEKEIIRKRKSGLENRLDALENKIDFLEKRVAKDKKSIGTKKGA
jgi:hypothetical protein